MSLQLLNSLNGSQNGAFYKWLQQNKKSTCIAWYPSAGIDFRPLMFLEQNSDFFKTNKYQPPDIFIYTDYFPDTYSNFLDSKVLYSDSRTKVTVEEIEQLADVDVALNPEIVYYPQGSFATNKVIFMKIKVDSSKIGEIYYPLLYIFSENESFFNQLLLPTQAEVTYIIHVRYGGGSGGGGYARGSWIPYVLNQINCKVLISDNNDIDIDKIIFGPGDEFFLSELKNKIKLELPVMKVLKKTPSSSWSRYGDVNWFKIGT